MNIEALKLELVQLLLNTKREDILMRIRQIYKDESVDWWDELNEEERTEIKTGIKQGKNGEVISHSEVLKQFEKWK